MKTEKDIQERIERLKEDLDKYENRLLLAIEDYDYKNFAFYSELIRRRWASMRELLWVLEN